MRRIADELCRERDNRVLLLVIFILYFGVKHTLRIVEYENVASMTLTLLQHEGEFSSERKGTCHNHNLNLTTLPAELNRLILSKLSTLADLYSIIRASPLHSTIFKESKRHILEEVFYRSFNPRHLLLAQCIAYAQHPRSTVYTEETRPQQSIERYNVMLHCWIDSRNCDFYQHDSWLFKISERDIYPGRLFKLSRMWLLIDRLIESYARDVLKELELVRTKLGCSPTVKLNNTYRHGLSKDEYERIQRAFLHLEIFARRQGRLEPHERVDTGEQYYLCASHAWFAYFLTKSENIELHSVYDYLVGDVEDRWDRLHKVMLLSIEYKATRIPMHAAMTPERLNHLHLKRQILANKKARRRESIAYLIEGGLRIYRENQKVNYFSLVDFLEFLQMDECKAPLATVLKTFRQHSRHDYKKYYQDDSDKLARKSDGYQKYSREKHQSGHKPQELKYALAALGYFFWDNSRLFDLDNARLGSVLPQPRTWSLLTDYPIISEEQLTLEKETLGAVFSFKEDDYS